MRELKWILISVLLLVVAGCSDSPSIEELRNFAAIENYPEDIFLDTVANKKALVIIAHDDDDCAMSGTIAKLTASGWKIKQISLTTHPMEGGRGENPGGIICEGNELLLKGTAYRMGLDTMKNPYLPISRDEMEKQFLRDKLAAAIINKTNKYKPSVIFSLDNIKGGYGHPEHIYLSQLVVDLFKEGKINPQRIYQSVYTDHMESEIVDKWLGPRLKKWGYPDASAMANKLYGINGMPDPNTQVNISEYSETKMKYLRSYPESVRKNLRKFMPYYEDFDAKTYFSVFNREFFRVIDERKI